MRSEAAPPDTDPAAPRPDRPQPSAPVTNPGSGSGRSGTRAGLGGGSRVVAGVLLVGWAGLLGGCGGGDVPPVDPPAVDGSVPVSESASAPAGVTDARAQLAGLAAAAEDRHLTARYTLSQSGQPNRTVTLVSAADGSWRVDIPGGALGGIADVAIAQTRDGIFQCGLPSDRRPDPSTCVRVAAPDRALPAGIDPRVQHVFTDWRKVLTDRQASLAISTSQPLPNSRGACFSVDSTAASLSAPLDIGIYCFDTDGTLTAARLGFGTLLLTGNPTAAPPTVTLPGPVVSGPALKTAAPPTPSADPTPGSTPTR
ncbi:hypothetical protein OG792_00210 [Micromonospora sp. NBC_01699]|uniref:hypothetical protein n=1 Tax=Micromonospora sp. NBC_01699 TaxID=2975984 RepID=UPI002E2C66E4|nr:hypothetical protein [Micromonospora sp. NBC_01699]